MGKFVKLGLWSNRFWGSWVASPLLSCSGPGLWGHSSLSSLSGADLYLLPQINSNAERYWLHVSSDASRLAIIWKYGGIYMDTDVISIRPIPDENFLAAQSSKVSSNGVFGFSPHHPFLWACMENFVEHYNSGIWGNQGPRLITRMLKLWCKLRDFKEVSDLKCQNMSFLHPHRFYPISYSQWKSYYEVWDPEPSFNNSYALHLWNHMNQGKRTVVKGSNTLAENLFRKYCPTTYRYLVQGPQRSVTRAT